MSLIRFAFTGSPTISGTICVPVGITGKCASSKILLRRSEPRGGAWMQGRYVPSLLAAIGEIIERHMGREVLAAPDLDIKPAARPRTLASPCPRCGAASLVKVEGCNKCLDCGYSKCG